MSEYDDIKLLYDEVTSMFTTEEQANFHLNSIKNFIQHIDEIPDNSIKSDVKNRIQLYLLFLNENRTNFSLNSLELFNEYVRPIGNIYEKYLQFEIKSKVWIVAIWFIIGAPSNSILPKKKRSRKYMMMPKNIFAQIGKCQKESNFKKLIIVIILITCKKANAPNACSLENPLP